MDETAREIATEWYALSPRQRDQVNAVSPLLAAKLDELVNQMLES